MAASTSVAVLSRRRRSVKRLSDVPPTDVTQEGKSGCPARCVLLPSGCMNLLPKVPLCLHRPLLRGWSDVVSQSGQLP